jgi:hypothetical protein
LAKARHLIFFGYSGSREPTGQTERDTSFHLVASTLKLHLERRFPDDVVELICAWHKDTFVNALRTPGPDPSRKIRQIHYVGHGAGGGLYFGYHNSVAVAERQQIADILTQPPAALLFSDGVKRRIALMWDAGLMSGFFSDALAASKRAEIKAQLAPDALMHVWGCFAGAPTHTFDTTDAYWNLFNVGGAVDGVARHVAKTLEVETTACFDPEGIHGMDFCFRTSTGHLNCSNVRPDRLPHWLWPESRKVRWVTHDATGAANVATINFLGTRLPAEDIAPGRPPKWLTDEIPLAAGKAKPPFPVCSAARAGI